jgi:hypothetical protein
VCWVYFCSAGIFILLAGKKFKEDEFFPTLLFKDKMSTNALALQRIYCEMQSAQLNQSVGAVDKSNITIIVALSASAEP